MNLSLQLQAQAGRLMPIDIEKGAVLLVNKPYEWTSFDVVKKIRNALQRKFNRKIKVGHAGTLDPLATGLLLICVGKATKAIESFTNLDKEYTGTMHLGATTPSFDLETPVDKNFPVEHITPELVRETTKKFLGESKQSPPVFSAVKVDGKPVYKKARKGHHVEIKPRNISIDLFEITDIQLPLVKFRVRCSKGTYIRSLVHDFGKALGSGAYLHDLCRIKIGEFSIEKAIELNELIQQISER
ncbi:MAG TPA: tRNA pseudouridine(55) synthase TruB [Chitinophagales bacterium]|nr:tRNA pseudouridine(55) synthase TruB [Chitinophagales bacterium]